MVRQYTFRGRNSVLGPDARTRSARVARFELHHASEAFDENPMVRLYTSDSATVTLSLVQLPELARRVCLDFFLSNMASKSQVRTSGNISSGSNLLPFSIPAYCRSRAGIRFSLFAQIGICIG
jgi:hypothetical protein